MYTVQRIRHHFQGSSFVVLFLLPLFICFIFIYLAIYQKPQTGPPSIPHLDLTFTLSVASEYILST
jgi:hypothetical protein